MPRRSLDEEEIRSFLVEIADRLAARGVTGRIYVVGGAALALTVFRDEERRMTPDVDASFRADEVMTEEIAAMARENGLADDWLNNASKFAFPPAGFPDGDVVHERDGVTVMVAPPEVLLAMKLRAARWGRDEDDIAMLVRECDVRSDDEALAVFDRYYLGEERLKDDALKMLAATRGEYVVTSSVPPIRLAALPPR